MYVCFARAFRRVPFCFLLDEESEGVDRAGRLFTMEGKWENKEKMSRRVHMFLAFWCFFGPLLSLLLQL